MLEKRMNNLKENLILEATLVEKMIEESITGLLQKEKKYLINTIRKNEPIINGMEIKIDTECINLIALFQPEAKNLRTIMMIIKMNNDIERIGDLAVNVAESSLYLIEKPDIKPLIDIPRMASEATKMLKNSISAFINEDEKLAKEVIENDDIVDNLQEQIIRELITFMSDDSHTIKRALHLIRIAHNLERIADLATNFSEDTIYIIKGKIIKHKNSLTL